MSRYELKTYYYSGYLVKLSHGGHERGGIQYQSVLEI